MTNSIENKKPSKILIMGLDNSGKTSILISLRENTNLLSYFSLRPTKGLSVEEFENDQQGLVCWDLGGQAQYRKNYLKDFGRYAKETEKIIFVIDVQDTNRYGLSLEYLEELIDVLKNDEYFIEISLFLHKFDPNLVKKEDFKELYEKIKTELVDRIQAIIPNNFNYDIFKTTIYTVFEKSLF
jgi:small GTP-binding protein